MLQEINGYKIGYGADGLIMAYDDYEQLVFLNQEAFDKWVVAEWGSIPAYMKEDE